MSRRLPSNATSRPQSQESPGSLPSILDSRLGLAPEDLAALRQHQQLAHAQARSPAGSQASSHGRLLLDPGSLQLLTRHFDCVMQAIAQRLEQLHAATEHATHQQSSRLAKTIAQADAEIARFHILLRQIDELENEFEKLQRIREMVRGFRSRVEGLEKRIGQDH